MFDPTDCEIVCIDDGGFTGRLTVGKTYITDIPATNNYGGNNYYVLIRDDQGNHGTNFKQSRFVPLKDYNPTHFDEDLFNV
jgi:hypothetical protein